MAILFGTDEWLDCFMERLNEDEKYSELAKDYEGALIFRCYADPKVHEILAKDRVFYFDPYKGAIREWRVVEAGDEAPAAKYELEGAYAAWKDVATGKVEIKKAVLMTRQIKVKGKISDLVKNITAAERIIEVLKDMRGEFVFPDDEGADASATA